MSLDFQRSHLERVTWAVCVCVFIAVIFMIWGEIRIDSPLQDAFALCDSGFNLF